MPGHLKITVPAVREAKRLTSLDSVRDELQLLDTTNDRYVTALIDRASAAIVKHCGRPFALQTAVEIFRSGTEAGLRPFANQVAPYGTPLQAVQRPLVLSLFPVVEITSLTNASSTLVEDTDFEVDYGAGLVDRLFGVSVAIWASTPITITYQAGYDLLDEIPDDLEAACLQLVKTSYFARNRDSNVMLDMLDGDRTQFTAGAQTPLAITDDICALLASYVQRAW